MLYSSYFHITLILFFISLTAQKSGPFQITHNGNIHYIRVNLSRLYTFMSE